MLLPVLATATCPPSDPAPSVDLLPPLAQFPSCSFTQGPGMSLPPSRTTHDSSERGLSAGKLPRLGQIPLWHTHVPHSKVQERGPRH